MVTLVPALRCPDWVTFTLLWLQWVNSNMRPISFSDKINCLPSVHRTRKMEVKFCVCGSNLVGRPHIAIVGVVNGSIINA